jgi:hypothetical protein
MKNLVEYLKTGNKKLLSEASFQGSATLGSIAGSPSIGSRVEKLRNAFSEAMSKFEAIMLDLMEVDPTMYEDSISIIKSIRESNYNDAERAVGLLQDLINYVGQAGKSSKYYGREIGNILEALQMLLEDLQYIATEFDPQVPKPPEIPPKSREQWDKEQRGATQGASSPKKGYKRREKGKKGKKESKWVNPMSKSLLEAPVGIKEASFNDPSSLTPVKGIKGEDIGTISRWIKEKGRVVWSADYRYEGKDSKHLGYYGSQEIAVSALQSHHKGLGESTKSYFNSTVHPVKGKCHGCGEEFSGWVPKKVSKAPRLCPKCHKSRK